MTACPYDMVGYGAEPPHAQWRRNARIALQFFINYEEGAESAIRRRAQRRSDAGQTV